MTLAVLVEGRSDKQVIRTLLQKQAEIINRTFSVKFAEFGGGQGLLDVSRVVNTCEAIARLNPDLTGAVVCKDMNCTPTNELETIRVDIANKLARAHSPLSIRYHFVRFELESWLASDESAWQRKFPKAMPHVLPHGILEECDPKDTIRLHLRARGIEFRYTQHDSAIASDLDLRVAASRNGNLREFLDIASELAGD